MNQLPKSEVVRVPEPAVLSADVAGAESPASVEFRRGRLVFQVPTSAEAHDQSTFRGNFVIVTCVCGPPPTCTCSW